MLGLGGTEREFTGCLIPLILRFSVFNSVGPHDQSNAGQLLVEQIDRPQFKIFSINRAQSPSLPATCCFPRALSLETQGQRPPVHNFSYHGEAAEAAGPLGSSCTSGLRHDSILNVLSHNSLQSGPLLFGSTRSYGHFTYLKGF